MPRIMNRLRLILDKSITCANALDKAAAYHPNSVLFHPSNPLPYDFLAEKLIDMSLLYRFVNKIGNLLKANGLQRYDRVAIYKTNNIDYFFLAQAVIKAGGITVPINPGMSSENVEYYLKYIGVKFVFTDHATIQKMTNFTEINRNYTWLLPNLPVHFGSNGIDINKSITSQSDELPAIELCNDSIVLIAHTSGTTGFPKGVLCSSGGVIASIKGHFKSEPIHSGNRIAIAGHYNHLVYYVGFFTSMLANMSTWILLPEDLTAIFDTIEKEKINIFFAFPDVYLRMFEKGLNNYNLRSVKIWIATADASHSVHLKAFCNAGAFLSIFGKKIINSIFIDVIGTSEVGSGALRRIILPFYSQSTNRCVGLPFIGGPNVKVADENGKKLPVGRPGRLMVKGKMLFKGYWNAHETLLGTMYDNWWWTGDCVVKNIFGQYYHLDRFADSIVSSQGTVYSLLVEEKLLMHPQILEAVVIGVPDEHLGHAPVAIVAPFSNVNLDTTALLTWANRAMVSEVPLRSIHILAAEKIPRGLTGKVLKRLLREYYKS